MANVLAFFWLVACVLSRAVAVFGIQFAAAVTVELSTPLSSSALVSFSAVVVINCRHYMLLLLFLSLVGGFMSTLGPLVAIVGIGVLFAVFL